MTQVVTASYTAYVKSIQDWNEKYLLPAAYYQPVSYKYWVLWMSRRSFSNRALAA